MIRRATVGCERSEPLSRRRLCEASRGRVAVVRLAFTRLRAIPAPPRRPSVVQIVCAGQYSVAKTTALTSVCVQSQLTLPGRIRDLAHTLVG